MKAYELLAMGRQMLEVLHRNGSRIDDYEWLSMYGDYLRMEAEEIVSKMSPKCPWRRDVWAAAMESHGYALEEAPYYNSCALWVTMCMIYSDSSSSIHAIMKMAGGTEGVSDKDFFAAVHMLALDKLKDADGVFDVRRYFEK